MIAGLTPEGDHWNKTLVEAEKSSDLFVQLSLTLYKVCTFQDSELNSQRLKTQLESFITNFPDYEKVADGPVIVEKIGLKKIREECAHFDRWVTRLEKL